MISNEWTYDCNNLCNACMMSHERNTSIARRSSCMVKFSTIIDWLLIKNTNAKQEIAGSSVSLEAKRREHKAAAHTGHRHTVCLPQTKSTHRAELDPHNSWHIIARAFEDEAQTVVFCVAYRLPVTWESAAPIFKLERGEPDGRLSFFLGWSRRFQFHVHGRNCPWSWKDANARASCFTKLNGVWGVIQQILNCFL
jgi:hypothetical protein